MLSKSSITVVASDTGLRRSLVFALEVEGFQVTSCNSWREAMRLGMSALAVIVDAAICRSDEAARQALLDPENNIILLSDGMLPSLDAINARIITKPFQAQDLLSCVRALVAPQ